MKDFIVRLVLLAFVNAAFYEAVTRWAGIAVFVGRVGWEVGLVMVICVAISTAVMVLCSYAVKPAR